MAKSPEPPEPLATFAAAAGNKGAKPADQGLTAKPETVGKSGNLDAEEKDAADILWGNAPRPTSVRTARK
jgi:hypothetical protein